MAGELLEDFRQVLAGLFQLVLQSHPGCVWPVREEGWYQAGNCIAVKKATGEGPPHEYDHGHSVPDVAYIH
jgi:hypothetical protein